MYHGRISGSRTLGETHFKETVHSIHCRDRNFFAAQASFAQKVHQHGPLFKVSYSPFGIGGMAAPYADAAAGTFPGKLENGKMMLSYNGKDTGLTVYGLKSGSCVITAAAAGVSSSGYVKVKIKFSGFDDGDGIIINRTITRELEGSITLDGNLTGSLNGTFTGCLTITASNPSWDDSEYLMAYYTEYTYTDDKIVREDVYSDAGADGEWFTGDDTVDYSIDYTYVSDKLDKKTVKDDYGVFIEIKDAADTTVGYTFEYEVEKE